jgi:hypothetical protein
MLSALFRKNRAAFPLSELAKYQGQWIAFDPEGTKVVAAAPTVGAVHKKVIDAGYDPEQVSFEGVPGPDDFLDLDNGEITSCCNSPT